MDAEAHEGHPEARSVDHLHHPVDAAAVARGVGRRTVFPRAAGQPGPGAVEGDLAGGDPDGAELRLQAFDGEAVG